MTEAQKIEYLVDLSCRLSDEGQEMESIQTLRNAVSILHALEEKTELMQQLYAANSLKLAKMLSDADRIPEAVAYFQAATDTYNVLGDSDAASTAAKGVLNCVSQLRNRPADRIFLLVAKYERQIAELSITPNMEVDCAKICHHVANILQRRNRYNESATWFLQELDYLSGAEISDEIIFSRAQAHNELGKLNFEYLRDPGLALEHYERAIVLLNTCLETHESASADLEEATAMVTEIRQYLSDRVH